MDDHWAEVPLKRTGHRLEGPGGEQAEVGKLPDGSPFYAAGGIPWRIGGGAGLKPLEAIPAAYAAVSLLSTTLRMLPAIPGTWTNRARDEWEPAPAGSPAEALLLNPSRWMDRTDLWDWFFRCYFLTGNAYLFKVRGSPRMGGVPIGLEPAVAIAGSGWYGPAGPGGTSAQDKRQRSVRVWMADGTREMTVDRRDLLELHGQGFDPWYGYSPSPIQHYAKTTLGMMRRAMEKQSDSMELGGADRTVLTLSPAVQDVGSAAEKRLRAEVVATYQVARLLQQPPMLPAGIEPKATGSMSAVDLQIIDLLRWGVEDVARVWLVPPWMLMHYASGFRFQHIAPQFTHFERMTVRPHSTKFGSAATVAVRPLLRDGETVFVVSEVLGRGTWADELEAAGKAVDRSILTRNEARRRAGEQPMEGGDEFLPQRGGPAPNAALDDLAASVAALRDLVEDREVGSA